jgi:predicted transcriptional regulator
VANPPLRLIAADKLGDLPPTAILGTTRFVARGLNVVFGASGSYKSFYVLGKALQVAQSIPVVYVAAEGSYGLNARVAAWCQHHRLPPGNLHFLCNEINLRDEAAVKTLAQATASIKPRFIVIDTLARCMLGGDENSAKDVGMAIHGCFLLQQTFSASICLVHHNNRADRGERGSGALRGAADTMIEVVAGGDGLIRISCSKTKDTEPWETEDLVFKPVADSGVLVSAASLETIAINLTPIEKQIMEFLALSVFDTAGAQIEQVVKALNISERHVYRLLSGLKNKGLARNVSKRLPMLLTDMGREILQTFADKNLPVSQTVDNIVVDD